MELVNCSIKYWEFVRYLRTHPNNLDGFVNHNNITSTEQKYFMSKNHKFFKICLQNNLPVGYIGLIGPKKDEITLAVTPEKKSSGIGSFMILNLLNTHNELWAKVKHNNAASIKLFQKLGFIQKIKNDFIYFYSYET